MGSFKEIGNKLKAMLGAAVAGGVLFFPFSLCALDIVPFNLANQSPFVKIHGLPAAGNAVLLPPGRKEFHATVDHASHYINEVAPSERIVLDGETTRMTVRGRLGVTSKVEMGIEIPYIVQGGGFLDGFLINYHQTFGFPQAGRDQAPRDRLLFRYEKNGLEKWKMNHSGNGPGDVSLSAAYQAYHDGGQHPRAVAIRTALKLPTGENGSLRGSGGADLALWATASDGHRLWLGHGAVFAALGCMAMAKGDILADQQQGFAGFGSVGLGWSPLAWIAFKVQLDAHTALYKDSRFKVLSADALQLQMGGSLALSERITLDIGVSEDIATQTAPDVAFHFDLGMRF